MFLTALTIAWMIWWENELTKRPDWMKVMTKEEASQLRTRKRLLLLHALYRAVISKEDVVR